jgi:TatD DNase family protein
LQVQVLPHAPSRNGIEIAMELIDIGVNLAHRRFAHDRDAVIERAVAAGVQTMIVTGTSTRASRDARALAAARRDVLWSTAGIHPHEARHATPDAIDELRELARHRAVRAIGECGLDFDRMFSPREDQERAFAQQLGLAAELGLPVFLHERSAHDRFAAILREHRPRLRGAVVHCFTGTAAELDVYLSLDAHIGITGWICDERRGVGLRALIPRIPRDRLMIETDAPFLLPRDLAKRPADGRNEPSFLPHVLAAVARAAGHPAAAVAEETTRTARAFFGIDGRITQS